MTDTDARLWHPWLRINRILRVMLSMRWSAEAWSFVCGEFSGPSALRSEIRLVCSVTGRETTPPLLNLNCLP